jgi:hypothetical protein
VREIPTRPDPARLPAPLRRIANKHLHWLPGWLGDRTRKAFRRRSGGTQHLLFALCDHFEPLHGEGTSLVTGLERVARWREQYPRLAKRFRDASGRHPRHSFFFPGEQYDPTLIEPIAEMVQMGLGEVEVHLHHESDTRQSLRSSLEKTVGALATHGVVPQYRGKPAWAFIHGNWCLANARRDGQMCGVDDEIPLLYELGCYADFTFPAARDESQPGIVNAIYYPRGDVARRRAYEDAERVRVGSPRLERLLLIQGPLAISRRPGSVRVRIDGGSLDWSDPPTAERLRTWVRQGISVEGRPDWVFVKVHTHGAIERNADVLLGEAMVRFHEALAEYNDGRRWKLHYLSAREMYNLARAAMDGQTGSPDQLLDYEVPPPPRVTGAAS